jgi:drug/metabolite transporter (DMT)-like permease
MKTTSTPLGLINLSDESNSFPFLYTDVINGMTPLVVSIADALILETQLPVLLWPSVLVSFVGCALIALAQSPLFVKSSSSSYVFTHRDAIGCVLQFVSVLFSSLARLLMKRTEHILTRDEMVQSNNLFNTLIPLTYTLLVPDARSQWKAFQETSVQSIVALLSIAVLVYTVGSTGQMSLVRKMGAGVYSSFSAIRVLGSVLFSSLFLGEPVQNWLEWLGLLVATLTMTLYTIASSVDSTSACLRSKNSLGEDDASNDEEEGVAMSPQKNWISIPTSDVVDEEVEDESGIQKESNVGLSSKSFDGISRATALSLHAASSQL